MSNASALPSAAVTRASFFFGGLARELWRMAFDSAVRRRRTVRPDRIDRILLDGDEFRAGRLGGFFVAFDLPRRVKPGIVTDLRARPQIAFEPFFRACRGERDGFNNLQIDLLAHLDRIAAIDEENRAILKHDREAGRAGEAREPG